MVEVDVSFAAKMVNKMCEVCSAAPFKYKCSKCLIKYCSVPCYNTHQASECKAPDTSSNDKQELVQRKYFFQTEDTVPQEKLSLLGESSDLVDILKDYELRHTLTAIDSASDQSRTIEKAMQHPVFVKFVDYCLRVVEY